MADPAFIPLSPSKEVTTVIARPKPSIEEIETIEPPKNFVAKPSSGKDADP